MKAQTVPFVMQPNFISVVVGGKPFQLLGSHPTFKAMARALKNKDWKKVPSLVTLAESISNHSHGDVEVKNGEVFYKGSQIDSSLTKRMVQLIEHNKPVTNMLKFMDNLMKNPSQECIRELYDFLQRCDLPVTDDGCFVAYKRVDGNYKDIHTGTIDNALGAVVTMPRTRVDSDSRVLCSSGYHFCSREYLCEFPGQRLMAIKINPADVVSIPQTCEGKGRTWRYEVIREIPNENYEKADAEYFQTPLVPVEKDRKSLIAKMLKLSAVKRLIARTERKRSRGGRPRKPNAHPPIQVAGLTKKALQKAALGRLNLWYGRFAEMEAPSRSPLFGNPTQPTRITTKLSVVQVAKEMGVKASEVYRMEKSDKPSQKFIDNYLGAVGRLRNQTAGVSYPAVLAKAA